MYRTICIGIFILAVTTSYSQTKIKAVGDVMMGSYTPRPIIPEHNGKIFVDSIANYLDSTDITFGNLEGVFVKDFYEPKKCRPESREAKRCYEFGMPDTLSHTLRDLNFNLISQDNNHVSDYGTEGIELTRKALNNLNINSSGKKEPILFNIDTVRFALLAFGTSSASWHVSDLHNTRKQVRKYDSLVDVVIISFHGGAEGLRSQHVYDTTEYFYGEDRGNLIAFSHLAIDCGADLILGHGPHVLRGLELYKNKLICYSLGNFLTYGNVSLKSVKGIGAIVNITIDNTSGDFISGEIIPTKQIYPGIPYIDKDGEAIAVIKALSKSDFKESKLLISNSGKLSKVL